MLSAFRTFTGRGTFLYRARSAASPRNSAPKRTGAFSLIAPYLLSPLTQLPEFGRPRPLSIGALRRKSLISGPIFIGTSAFGGKSSGEMVDKEELRKRLTPLQYHVTQEKGTERPFTGMFAWEWV